MLSVRLKDGKLQNSTVAKIDDKGRINLTIKGVTEEDKEKCIN